jgi:hypothetical protein
LAPAAADVLSSNVPGNARCAAGEEAMAKTLCRWKKSRIEDDLEAFKELVRKAKFVCRRCGRAAADKKSLCKPARLD